MTDIVLYIEDNPDNVRLVQRLLRRRSDVDLRVATTARAGIQAATDQQPRLILLDNRLPDGSGRDVLRDLRAAQVTAPVIIVSGDSGGQIAGELVAAGAAAVLEKPFDIHHFLTMIDSYLA